LTHSIVFQVYPTTMDSSPKRLIKVLIAIGLTSLLYLLGNKRKISTYGLIVLFPKEFCDVPVEIVRGIELHKSSS